MNSGRAETGMPNARNRERGQSSYDDARPSIKRKRHGLNGAVETPGKAPPCARKLRRISVEASSIGLGHRRLKPRTARRLARKLAVGVDTV